MAQIFEVRVVEARLVQRTHAPREETRSLVSAKYYSRGSCGAASRRRNDFRDSCATDVRPGRKRHATQSIILVSRGYRDVNPQTPICQRPNDRRVRASWRHWSRRLRPNDRARVSRDFHVTTRVRKKTGKEKSPCRVFGEARVLSE